MSDNQPPRQSATQLVEQEVQAETLAFTAKFPPMGMPAWSAACGISAILGAGPGTVAKPSHDAGPALIRWVGTEGLEVEMRWREDIALRITVIARTEAAWRQGHAVVGYCARFNFPWSIEAP